MAIITRSSKGSELTHNEMDNNFTELEQRIAGKANASHTHSIANINGLQDELDGKIDEGAVNVANGLLRLNSSAKVPCEFLTDCFGAGGKVATSYLFAENGKVKPELLPSGECDCTNNWRIVSGSVVTSVNDDVIILNGDSILNIASLPVSKILTIRRLVDTTTVAFDANVEFLNETNGTNWTTGTGINAMVLINTTGQWYQIG